MLGYKCIASYFIIFTFVLVKYRCIIKGENFIIDHSGHMATTLSPKELREIKSQNKNGPSLPVQLYDENYDSTYHDSNIKDFDTSDYGNVAKEASDSKDTNEKPDALRDKCQDQGGVCNGFKGCDTELNVYKDYCTTDYSEVCCVPRQTICEVNDGICTDDPEACTAAGEIMGRKYNLKFYTWLDCNQTHVCCRPSHKSNIFSHLSGGGDQESTSNSVQLEDEPDEKTLREMFRNQQLGNSVKGSESKRKSRLAKIATGKAYRAPAGFPSRDVVSSVFKAYPDKQKKKTRTQTKSRSLKPKKNYSGRNVRNNKRRPKLNAKKYRTAATSVPASPIYPAPVPLLSPYASLLYGLAQQSQQPTSYIPASPQGTINEYLSDYQGLGDLSAAYSGLRSPIHAPQPVSPISHGNARNKHNAANHGSLFGNIYL